VLCKPPQQIRCGGFSFQEGFMFKRIAFAIAASALFITAAVAQFGTPSVIPVQSSQSVIDVGQAFGWLAPYINSLIGLIISGGLAWLGTLLHKKFNLDIDANARDALTTFLERQAASLVADGAVKLNGMQVNVESPMLAAAAKQALTSIPGTLKRFGVTPDKVSSVIGDMIVDYVHKVPAVAAVVAAAPPAAAAPK
jgi:hypothetical protein